MVLGPPPAVLCDRVIELEPASTQSIPVDSPVLPAVCPVLLTPKPLIADCVVCAAFPLKRMYCVAPFTLELIEIFPALLNETVPEV